jgi:hypothetical protein
VGSTPIISVASTSPISANILAVYGPSRPSAVRATAPFTSVLNFHGSILPAHSKLTEAQQKDNAAFTDVLTLKVTTKVEERCLTCGRSPWPTWTSQRATCCASAAF